VGLGGLREEGRKLENLNLVGEAGGEGGGGGGVWIHLTETGRSDPREKRRQIRPSFAHRLMLLLSEHGSEACDRILNGPFVSFVGHVICKEIGDVPHSKRCCRVPRRRNRYLVKTISDKEI
jgi:hypothetical protein